MSINSPVVDVSAPSMYANDLFNSQHWRSRSTGALTDNGGYTFTFGEDGASVMNGVYFGYITDATDKACLFTVTGGDTVTLLQDYGTDFVVNATTTDARVQIAAGSTGLTIVNRIDAGIAGLELVKLL